MKVPYILEYVGPGELADRLSPLRMADFEGDDLKGFILTISELESLPGGMNWVVGVVYHPDPEFGLIAFKSKRVIIHVGDKRTQEDLASFVGRQILTVDPTWKNTLNCPHGADEQTMEQCAEMALKMDYRFMAWNDRVYPIVLSGLIGKDIGTVEEVMDKKPS